MRRLNFSRLNGEKIMQDLQLYIQKILAENERLRERVATFQKDKEIEKLTDEICRIRQDSLLIMSEKEKNDAKSFSEEHYQKCKSNIVYILEATGLGTATTLKCKKCSAEKDITDSSNW